MDKNEKLARYCYELYQIEGELVTINSRRDALEKQKLLKLGEIQELERIVTEEAKENAGQADKNSGSDNARPGSNGASPSGQHPEG